MNITSKFTRSYNWLTITLEECDAKVSCDVCSILEAKQVKEELLNIVQDLNIYIKHMKNKKL